MLRATVNTINKHWAGMPTDKLRQNQSSLVYIRDLAGKTNTNISRWNIVSIFGSGSGAELINDVNQINKIFFQRIAQPAPDPTDEVEDQPEPQVEIPALMKITLQNISRNSLANELRQAEYELNRSKEEARRLWINYNNTLVVASRADQKLEALRTTANLNERGERVEKELLEVIKGGFWGDLQFRGNAMWLTTVNPITLSEIRRAAGVEIVAPLGRFAASFDFSNQHIIVAPYKGNKRVDSHFYHPHVNTTGEICWGDARDMAENARISWKIKDLFFIMQELLSSYNSGNPYRSLDRFVDARAYGRIAAELRCPQLNVEEMEESVRQELASSEGR